MVVSLRSPENLRPCLSSRPGVAGKPAACVSDDHAVCERPDLSGGAGGRGGNACASDCQAACYGTGQPDHAGEAGLDASTSGMQAGGPELLKGSGAESAGDVPAYEFAILECLHCSSSEPSQPSFFMYTLQPIDAPP